MKIIKSNAELIKEVNPFKQIERIGRTCYKSEDKITETSCYKFVQNLIDNKHFAMLEHGRAVFRVVGDKELGEFCSLLSCPDVQVIFDVDAQGGKNALVAVSLSHLYNPRYSCIMDMTMMRELLRIYISQRYAIPLDLIPEVPESYYRFNEEHQKHKQSVENVYRLIASTFFEYVEEDKVPLDMKSFSIKFICDRGVSHELVRHRVSVAQESTRYCNYSKEKFGKELTFVYPFNYEDRWTEEGKYTFKRSCEDAEDNYMYLIGLGYTPQEARAVLPNSLKTECVLTMRTYQWAHFFDMRYRGLTGQPHPDMLRVARIAHQLFEEKEKLDL